MKYLLCTLVLDRIHVDALLESIKLKERVSRCARRGYHTVYTGMSFKNIEKVRDDGVL
jgi:hypothetical protein